MTTPDPTGKTPLISTTSQQFVMALMILALATMVILIIGFVHVPKENQTLFTALVGGIAGWVGATIAFYFPSSVGSRSKDEAIATMAAQIASSPPTTQTVITTTKKDTPEDADPPADPTKPAQPKDITP